MLVLLLGIRYLFWTVRDLPKLNRHRGPLLPPHDVGYHAAYTWQEPPTVREPFLEPVPYDEPAVMGESAAQEKSESTDPATGATNTSFGGEWLAFVTGVAASSAAFILMSKLKSNVPRPAPEIQHSPVLPAAKQQFAQCPSPTGLTNTTAQLDNSSTPAVEVAPPLPQASPQTPVPSGAACTPSSTHRGSSVRRALLSPEDHAESLVESVPDMSLSFSEVNAFNSYTNLLADLTGFETLLQAQLDTLHHILQ